MVTVVTTIIAKEKIFDELPLEKDKFLPCLKKIQDTYNDISYHN